ncbi:MAG: citrate transporter [Clostridiales bacterium]|nr:citrate transporter [Clostridiales bacterium]
MRAHGVRQPHHFHIGLFLHGHVLPFVKKNAVLLIALCAAAITACIIPPSKAYLGYFDWKTLTCLFCVLAVVCALKNIRFFFFLAQKIVRTFKNARACVLALAYVTFIGSMLIANDMALLTFLPLGYFVLSSTGKRKYMAFTFIMQNIAANLGGMLTPFGNPQNLYLYTKYLIPTGEFMLIMLVPFLISVALITLCCIIFVKKEDMTIEETKITLPLWRTIAYGVLFALSIVIVFRVIPFWIGLIVIPIALLFLDRKALGKVDYGLLLTFMAFFIFSGNMAQIPAIQRIFGSLLSKNPLLVSTLSCQVISNVPSAILLSQFTSNYEALLLGVNIGGCGTLISSLASLITFREYTSHNPGGGKKYILLFSAFNFAFLGILFGACFLLTM